MSQPGDFTSGEDFAPEAHLDPDERDLEAPPEDAVEQATPVEPVQERIGVHRSFEVDEWDAIEQARVVAIDDDDYR